jgi:hypothetical protein
VNLNDGTGNLIIDESSREMRRKFKMLPDTPRIGHSGFCIFVWMVHLLISKNLSGPFNIDDVSHCRAGQQLG